MQPSPKFLCPADLVDVPDVKPHHLLPGWLQAPGQGAGPQPLVAELHHREGVAGASDVGGSQAGGRDHRNLG